MTEHMHNDAQGMDEEQNTLGGIIEANWDDVYEFTTIPEGKEVQVLVKSAEIHKSQSGNLSLHLILTVPSEPKANDIHHYQGIPDNDIQDDDIKDWNKRMLRLKKVYQAFGVAMRPQTPASDFNGRSAWVTLGVDPAEGQYEEKNTIDTWIRPA